jgi:hypothetical protein
LKIPLELENIDCNIHLVYWTPQLKGNSYNILECEFWPSNEHVNYDRFYIRAGVVKSIDRKCAEDLLKKEVIPNLIGFIKYKLNQPVNSTKYLKLGYFVASFCEGKVTMNI